MELLFTTNTDEVREGSKLPFNIDCLANLITGVERDAIVCAEAIAAGKSSSSENTLATRPSWQSSSPVTVEEVKIISIAYSKT